MNVSTSQGPLYGLIRPDGYVVVGEGVQVAEEALTSGRVTVAEAFASDIGSECIVVRPDGYIAAAGDSSAISAWLKLAAGVSV